MKDDFNLDDFETQPEEVETNKDKFNNVLAYIPFLNLWLLFTQNTGSKELNKKYIRQGITFFLLYVVVFFIMGVLSFQLSFLLSLLYFASVIFFGAKAYNGMYIEIEIIEKIMDQFNPIHKKEKK